MEQTDVVLQEISRKLDDLAAKMPKPLPELMTAQQMADYLGIKVQTASLWRHQGIGPGHIKIEKCVRYPVKEVDSYLKRQSVNC